MFVVLCTNLDSIFSVEEQQSISICYLKYGMCRDAIDMLRPQGNSLSLVGGKVWQCQIM